MGDTTRYPALTNGVWKGLLVAQCVIAAAAVVAVALARSWLGVFVVAVVVAQAAQGWIMRPGWVAVLDGGLEVKGADGARLRPRLVEWSRIRGWRRLRWTTVVVLELEGGREQALPELSEADMEAVVAAVTARLPVGPPGPVP